MLTTFIIGGIFVVLALLLAYVHYMSTEKKDIAALKKAEVAAVPRASVAASTGGTALDTFVRTAKQLLGPNAAFMKYDVSINPLALLKFLETQHKITHTIMSQSFSGNDWSGAPIMSTLYELKAKKGEKALIYLSSKLMSVDELDTTVEYGWEVTETDLQYPLDAQNDLISKPTEDSEVNWHYPVSSAIRLSYPIESSIKNDYVREAISASNVVKIVPDEPVAQMELLTVSGDEPRFRYLNNLMQLSTHLPEPNLNYAPAFFQYGLDKGATVKMEDAINSIKVLLEAGTNVSFSGSPGVGKTVLAEMLCAEMSLAGYRVLKLDYTTLKKLLSGNDSVFEAIFERSGENRIMFYVPQGERLMLDMESKSEFKDFLDGALKRQYKYTVIMEYNGLPEKFDPSFFRSGRFLNIKLQAMPAEQGLKKLRSLESEGNKINEILFHSFVQEDSTESDEGHITIAQIYDCIIPDHSAIEALQMSIRSLTDNGPSAQVQTAPPKKVVSPATPKSTKKPKTRRSHGGNSKKNSKG